jgi:hypothetical protein
MMLTWPWWSLEGSRDHFFDSDEDPFPPTVVDPSSPPPLNMFKLPPSNIDLLLPSDRNGLTADSVSSAMVLLQCLIWCLKDFCWVNHRLQFGHCFVNFNVSILLKSVLLDQIVSI